ncbi:hypothetical protein DFA_12278 [Cavenderia fasciculata]|uniref:Uncharacterized protein n=1 Tax=Cavenderia fasciculata TaxID=261658 RepID=F4QCX8_CACFS|nr:uncharacterized protein DFA_12278 [Cavenderia fasciculata]EGG14502.1 hypothetical protein DFA_12278 [Cavenderia fasciculata]|eukprot:XP_004353911.1 hypothetical protein DFA_12278 [Cavenderia fasciculata]
MEERQTRPTYQIGSRCPLCREDYSKEMHKLDNHIIHCFLYLIVDMDRLDTVKETIKEIEIDEQIKKNEREREMVGENKHQTLTRQTRNCNQSLILPLEGDYNNTRLKRKKIQILYTLQKQQQQQQHQIIIVR